ncbi:MAG TPA: CocE/NonD family hydrolase [Gemmatimonadaceae bacterium]|nr:CocE/NonD family hydrolase [Gemmatimonadaceae bacterium]
MRIGSRFRLTGLLLAGFAAVGAAQQPHSIEARYAKTEVRIPMRDGTQLFTAVYTPRDTSRNYAIMITRTPYSIAPYGPTAFPRSLGPSPRFADDGFIFVYQDVRGRFLSDGNFVHMTPWRGMAGAISTDESTDAYDTIDWVVKHVSHNTGRVGIWGISYGGYFTAAALAHAHPALKAASPQAPQADWFLGDDVHHHGAFLLASAFEFFATSGLARPKPTVAYPARFEFGTDDGYKFFLDMGPLSNADRQYLKGRAPFWNDMMAHGSDDAFWEARRLGPQLRDITPAVLTVSGWYDANNLRGALIVHESIEKQSPTTSNRIALGPWSHGQWSRGTGDALGDLRFGSATSLFFRDSIEFPFFKHYLEGGEDLGLPAATAFETGDNRWRTFDSWPPKAATPRMLYFHSGGTLSLVSPLGNEGNAFDQYVSDPASPVPFLERPNTSMKPDYMAYDQRFTAARSDVLVYQTEPLAADLTIAGSVRPTLYVSTSGTDSDWIVKLIDVHPDAASTDATTTATSAGFQELVRGDVMRGKFRNSYSKPEAFVPGRVERVSFGMDDVLHTFKKGHRIMVHIQSSWFPLVDRNPQKFVDIYNASASDFTKATERVFHAAQAASGVELPVLP